MKIGILTYPLNNNYGCYLQSYALQSYLKKKGYEVDYIYRRHDKPSFYFYLRYAISTVVDNIKKIRWKNPYFDFEGEYMLSKGQKLYPFFLEHICTQSIPIYTTRALRNACSKYDVIIVGSDQVWRAEILSNIEDYFLSFLGASKVRRIAYAASFGKDNPGYTEKQKKKCGEALRKFCAISVREDVGLDIINEFGWTVDNVKVVVDPTMLIEKKEYESFIEPDKAKETVFGYILDQTQEKTDLLTYVSHFYKTESFNVLEGCNAPSFMYPSVGEWLGGLSKSKFVLTDSFHGAVFSIIFNKPFAVIINEGRGAARFNTLLQTFNLADRVIKDRNDLIKVLNQDIDWDKVNAILNTKRIESDLFLKNGIEGK